MSGFLKVTESRTVFNGGSEQLRAAHARFERDNCLLIPELVEVALADIIRAELAKAAFGERVDEGIAIELCLSSETLTTSFDLIFNDPTLFSAIDEITKCGSIGAFDSRVYRLEPGGKHRDSWHDDNSASRLVGLSINLSAGPYQGGTFQMRDARSERIVCEIANVGFADAILFRISPTLQHRITDVEGTVAKTSLAGWFQREPDFRVMLQKKVEQLRTRATVTRGR